MNRLLLYASTLPYTAAAMLAGGAAWGFARGDSWAGWLLVLAAGLTTSAGIAVHAAIRDAEKDRGQRQSEVALLEAEIAQQRASIDSLADGLDVAVFICDPKATVLYANRRAQEMFNFDNPSGRTILAVTLSYELEQLVLGAASTDDLLHAELAFAYPSERSGQATAWGDESGHRVFLSIYDVTDLKRLERIRRDFVSNVSHELRTPLTIIRSMAESIQDEEVAADRKTVQFLGRIIEEVDRLASMARDLLVLTTAESKPIERVTADVGEILRSTTDQLQGKAEAKGLELRYQGPWSLMALIDPEQIRQVALNLIDNAINYTNSGRVIVVLRVENSDLVASVNDTGIGIATEHLPRIFERFYRVDKGRSRNTGGTGLGLSIVKHIVEAHGGSVGVDSSFNEGSTFTIRLPLAEAKQTLPSTGEDEPSAAR